MSTKVTESCPKCGNSVMPTDKVMVYGTVPCKTWRYECDKCGHVWANDMQREHNGREYTKMYKAINKPEYGG